MKKVMVFMCAILVFVPSEELMAQSEKSLYFYHDGRIVGTYACSDIDSITLSMENDVEWIIWRGNIVNRLSVAMVDSVYFVSSNSSYQGCPDANHPHWIDLGLPSGTQWRCCNEGASMPEGYGDYYTFRQVASAPSLDQIIELLNNTTSVWTTQNGVNGREFTGRNGGSVFLPAAGCHWIYFYYVNLSGYYWSSSPNDDDGGAFYLFFDSDSAVSEWDYWNLHGERPVRPVR